MKATFDSLVGGGLYTRIYGSQKDTYWKTFDVVELPSWISLVGSWSRAIPNTAVDCMFDKMAHDFIPKLGYLKITNSSCTFEYISHNGIRSSQAYEFAYRMMITLFAPECGCEVGVVTSKPYISSSEPPPPPPPVTDPLDRLIMLVERTRPECTIGFLEKLISDGAKKAIEITPELPI